MTDIAIRAEGLGKQFHIGRLQRGHKSFREVVVDALLSPVQRVGKLLHGHATGAADLDDTFWALRDVGFQIKHGEVVGIIGCNGAGKSTLLKVLSRITEPTAGFVEVHGRVGSLLEVGTGFHPELTGRERIRASVTSVSTAIAPEILIERFLDTPVKHYSSGMQTRLGFAVAAHLDPEILIVDEVLAVGDAGFQKKCLGKMQDVAKGGRTVVFVSHNMGMVTQLCKRALWLDAGMLRSEGLPEDIVSQYLESGTTDSAEWTGSEASAQSSKLMVTRVRMLTQKGVVSTTISYDSAFQVEIVYELSSPIRNLVVAYKVIDARGHVVWESFDVDTGFESGQIREPGMYASVCKVPGCVLRPGRYFLGVSCWVPRMGMYACHNNVLSFEITEVGCQMDLRRMGLTCPLLEWDVMKLNDTVSQVSRS
ncbi:MAG: ABC transporter ATP-binding protein [Acidobacteriota bacterium]